MNQKIKDINIAEFLREDALLKSENQVLSQFVKKTEDNLKQLHQGINHPDFFFQLFELLENVSEGFDKGFKNYLKAEELRETRKQIIILEEVVLHFPEVIRRAFPKEANSEVIKDLLNELKLSNFETCAELQSHLFGILMRICFSKGEYKVFDLKNESYFDREVIDEVFANDLEFNDEWLDQLMYCLYAKSHPENLKLIAQTSAQQLKMVSPMITELFGLGVDALINFSTSN
jgi:hypothetical protein